LTASRTALVAHFNQRVLPLERQLCVCQFKMVERLLSFTDRKSLSQNYKDELFEVIIDLHQSLLSSPFRGELDLDDLGRRIGEANCLDIDTEELDAMRRRIAQEFKVDLDLSDDDLRAILHNPDLLLRKLAAFFATEAGEADEAETPWDEELGDSYADSDGEGADFEQGFGNGAEAEGSGRHELFISKGVLNRCYKKLANKFHPDKASEADKPLCQRLMSELSKAKRNQDAFTIFMLYQEHIQDDEFQFSDDELKKINWLLTVKLRELEDEKREFEYDNSLDSLIYRQFNGRSQRATDTNLREHAEQLADRIDSMTDDHRRLTNLREVKDMLQFRRSLMAVQYLQFDD
jgi:hypothetical protein